MPCNSLAISFIFTWLIITSIIVIVIIFITFIILNVPTHLIFKQSCNKFFFNAFFFLFNIHMNVSFDNMVQEKKALGLFGHGGIRNITVCFSTFHT